MDQKPIIFFASNDHKSNLLYLITEEKEVGQCFGKLVISEQYKFHPQRTATLDDIYDIFIEHGEYIKIFHFAGHSNQNELILFGESSKASQLKELIKNSHHKPELVFLNGCSNEPQVKFFLEAGVDAVIGTSVKIQDQVALDFASMFYNSLVNGKNLLNAFNIARSKIEGKIGSANRPRSIDLEAMQEVEEAVDFPWGLFVRNKKIYDWKIENLILTPQLPDDLSFPSYFWWERLFGKKKLTKKRIETGIKILRDSVRRICEEELKPLEKSEIKYIENLSWRKLDNRFNRQGDAEAVASQGSLTDHVKLDFKEVNLKLLVLGFPGSGKTIALCKLILWFLYEQRKFPTPIFLRLSTWKALNSFMQWIYDSINEKYGLSSKLTRYLIENDLVSFCFDGLDEIDERLRTDFLRSTEKMLPTQNVIITSRIEQFKNLQIRLSNYVEYYIEPLETDQIKEVLDSVIEDKDHIDIVVNSVDQDKELKTSLVLNLIGSVYKELPQEERAPFLELKETDDLWEKYVEIAFKDKYPKEKRIGYDKDGQLPAFQSNPNISKFKFDEFKLRNWSIFLSRKMPDTTFLLNHLQPLWLNGAWEIIVYVLVSRVLGGVLCSIAAGFFMASAFGYVSGGIIGGFVIAITYLVQHRKELKQNLRKQVNLEASKDLLYENLPWFRKLLVSSKNLLLYTLPSVVILAGYYSLTGNRMPNDIHGQFAGTDMNVGILIGLILGIVYGEKASKQELLLDIRLVESKTRNILDTLKVGLISGLVLGLGLSVIGFLINQIFSNSSLGIWSDEISSQWGMNIIFIYFILSMPMGFILGIGMGWSKPELLQKDFKSQTSKRGVNPRQGISRNLVASSLNAMIVIAIVFIIWGAIASSIFQTHWDGIYKSARNAIGLGIVLSLWWIGVDFTQHWILRIIIFVKGRGPTKYISFLSDLEKLGLVRRSGSSYRFYHKTLQEYFAHQEPVEDLKKGRLFVARCLVYGLLILAFLYPPYLFFTNYNKEKVLWQEPNQMGFEILSREILPHQSKDNAFVIDKDGYIKITGSGIVSVGNFTGKVTPLGTEAAFWALPITDKWDLDGLKDLNHGCLAHKVNDTGIWTATFGHYKNPVPGFLADWIWVNYPYQNILKVEKGDTITFAYNDIEWQNNSGNLKVKLEYCATRTCD